MKYLCCGLMFIFVSACSENSDLYIRNETKLDAFRVVILTEDGRSNNIGIIPAGTTVAKSLMVRGNGKPVIVYKLGHEFFVEDFCYYIDDGSSLGMVMIRDRGIETNCAYKPQKALR